MQSSRSRRAALVAVLGLLLGSSSRTAAAQGNYRLSPVGGRTTLVGGTGLAFGRDSASAFLNPATVVRVDAGRLAFSVNFYELSLFTSSSWYAPGAVDSQKFGDVKSATRSVTKFGFESLPSSLCIFLRVADVPLLAREASKELRARQARLGICLATVQDSDFSFDGEDFSSGDVNGGTRQAQTVRQSFRRIAVGPTYAMWITNALAMGASIHASRAAFRSLFQDTATTHGSFAPVSSLFYSSTRGDSYDVSATLGATYRIGRFQTLAASIESPSIHVFGHGGINTSNHYEGAQTGTGTSTLAADGDFAAYTPMRVALGTGIERDWGSAEVNVSYHVPVASAYGAQLQGNRSDAAGGKQVETPVSLDLARRAAGAVNIGVGGEVAIAPSLSMLGGLSTDLTTVPRGALLDDPMNYFPSRTNKVAGAVGLGSHGEGGDLYLGGELGFAWGERLAVNPYVVPARLETTSYEAFTFLVVIAGSTSFKAIKRAVEDLTEVVVAPPTTPAPHKPLAPAPPPAPPSPPPAQDPSSSDVPKG